MQKYEMVGRYGDSAYRTEKGKLRIDFTLEQLMDYFDVDDEYREAVEGVDDLKDWCMGHIYTYPGDSFPYSIRELTEQEIEVLDALSIDADRSILDKEV